jgi:hypothetical protein
MALKEGLWIPRVAPPRSSSLHLHLASKKNQIKSNQKQETNLSKSTSAIRVCDLCFQIRLQSHILSFRAENLVHGVNLVTFPDLVQHQIYLNHLTIS